MRPAPSIRRSPPRRGRFNPSGVTRSEAELARSIAERGVARGECRGLGVDRLLVKVRDAKAELRGDEDRQDERHRREPCIEAAAKPIDALEQAFHRKSPPPSDHKNVNFALPRQ